MQASWQRSPARSLERGLRWVCLIIIQQLLCYVCLPQQMWCGVDSAGCSIQWNIYTNILQPYFHSGKKCGIWEPPSSEIWLFGGKLWLFNIRVEFGKLLPGKFDYFERNYDFSHEEIHVGNVTIFPGNLHFSSPAYFHSHRQSFFVFYYVKSIHQIQFSSKFQKYTVTIFTVNCSQS